MKQSSLSRLPVSGTVAIVAVIVAFVAWRELPAADYYLCRSFDHTYVLAQVHCADGECASTEWDGAGNVTMQGDFTKGTMYRNQASDTAHAYCMPVSKREAEKLKSPAVIPNAHGESYSGDKLGTEITQENTHDIAIIENIVEIDGKTYVTYDPVTADDCGEDTAVSPYICDKIMLSSYYRWEGDVTQELAADAGPYFISYLTGTMAWRTMDMTTMQANLAGDIRSAQLFPEYYNPLFSESFFHIREENGVVTQVTQVYLP